MILIVWKFSLSGPYFASFWVFAQKPPSGYAYTARRHIVINPVLGSEAWAAWRWDWTTSRKVTKDNFCTSVHSISLQIFSHSMSQASASSGMDLPVNLEGLCLMKSSIVTRRVGATTALGYAAIGCIASTIRWTTCAISSTPALFLLLRLVIAWARHIFSCSHQTVPVKTYTIKIS